MIREGQQYSKDMIYMTNDSLQLFSMDRIQYLFVRDHEQSDILVLHLVCFESSAPHIPLPLITHGRSYRQETQGAAKSARLQYQG